MTSRTPLALIGALVLVAGCDSSDPDPVMAEVQFTQTVGDAEVVVGRFDAVGRPLDLSNAYRTTIDVDPGSLSFSASYSEDLGGHQFVLLLVDDGPGAFSPNATLLAGPFPVGVASAEPAPLSLARRSGSATAEVTVFAVPQPGERPRGRVTLTFRRDGGPNQDVSVDLADHVVEATPSLRVVGSDLNLADDDEGFGYSVEVDEETADLVPLSVYRARYLVDTDRCRSGGGSNPAAWDAETGVGLSTPCAGLDPETFEYLLYLLER